MSAECTSRTNLKVGADTGSSISLSIMVIIFIHSY